MINEDQDRGASGLVSDALMHLSRIIRGELALAQSEVATSLRHAGMGLALIVVAAVLAITALNLLSMAAVAGVVYAGVPAPWAGLLVGAVFALAAYLALRSGLAALKPAQLVPERALRGLRRDAETLKEGLMP